MKPTWNEDKTWVSDKNGNRCSVSHFGSKVAAEMALRSLKGCENCVECKNCKSSVNCTNCWNCKGCWNCKDCTDCWDCRDCTDCWDCRDCTDCWGLLRLRGLV